MLLFSGSKLGLHTHIVNQSVSTAWWNVLSRASYYKFRSNYYYYSTLLFLIINNNNCVLIACYLCAAGQIRELLFGHSRSWCLCLLITQNHRYTNGYNNNNNITISRQTMTVDPWATQQCRDMLVYHGNTYHPAVQQFHPFMFVVFLYHCRKGNKVAGGRVQLSTSNYYHFPDMFVLLHRYVVAKRLTTSSSNVSPRKKVLMWHLSERPFSVLPEPSELPVCLISLQSVSSASTGLCGGVSSLELIYFWIKAVAWHVSS